MLLHHQLLQQLAQHQITDLCFDELESWEISQHVPTTHGLFLYPGRRFILALFGLPINRKGNMTADQRKSYENWVLKYGKVPKTNYNNLISAVIDYLNSAKFHPQFRGHHEIVAFIPSLLY